MSVLMMKVHTCATDDSPFTMVYVRSLSDVMMNIHTGVADNIPYTMVYVRSLSQM